MEKKIERERKWLLKRLPEETYENCKIRYDIEQFYTKDGWRYRRQESLDGDYVSEYIKLKKISVGTGINHEIDVENITEMQYDEEFDYHSPSPVVRKRRYLVEYEGRVLEIDSFYDITLTIVEVEDVDIGDTVKFPEWLEKEVIMEVTGNSKFSNHNLAIVEGEEEEDEL